MIGPDELAITALKADGTLTAFFGGRFFADEAPAGTAFPFVIVQLMPGEVVFENLLAISGGPAGTDESELQVSIFAISRASLKTLATAVEASLTDLSNETVMFFRRVNQTVSLDPEKGPSGADVWRVLLVFKVIQEAQ